MSFAIAFPNIDPIIFSVGPLAIRWYGLAYLAGVLLGIQYIKAFAAKPPYAMDRKNADDFLIWVFLGIFLGGRLGYIAFARRDLPRLERGYRL